MRPGCEFTAKHASSRPYRQTAPDSLVEKTVLRLLLCSKLIQGSSDVRRLLLALRKITVDATSVLKTDSAPASPPAEERRKIQHPAGASLQSPPLQIRLQIGGGK